MGMQRVTLRELFAEFPKVPEEVLVQAQGSSSLLKALRAGPSAYAVLYEVDHEYTATLVPVDPQATLDRRLASALEGDAQLYYKGESVSFDIKKVVTLEDPPHLKEGV